MLQSFSRATTLYESRPGRRFLQSATRYTYIEDGEPFYDETLTYVRRLNETGVVGRRLSREHSWL